MGDNKATAGGREAVSSATTCQHSENCCVVPAKSGFRIGRKWATALAGFVSGAAVAAIILIPWMYIQGRFCDENGATPVWSVNQVLPDGAEQSE